MNPTPCLPPFLPPSYPKPSEGPRVAPGRTWKKTSVCLSSREMYQGEAVGWGLKAGETKWQLKAHGSPSFIFNNRPVYVLFLDRGI